MSDASASSAGSTSNLAGVAAGPYPRGVPTRLLSLAALILAGGAAAAEPPPPPLGVPELTGTRTLALGAGVGLPTGTEALFLNPAALGARRRYIVDTFFLADRRPDRDAPANRQDFFGGSVLDSSTTRVAAGLAYVRALKGVETGTMLRLGVAVPVGEGLLVGLQGNYYDLRGEERVASALNLDAGVYYQVMPKVSFGASAYNLLHTEHKRLLPGGYAVGIALGSDTSLQVAADWRVDRGRVTRQDGSARQTSRYSVGAEYFFNGAIPLRAGFEADGATDTRWWSAGAGYVSARFALDLGLRQNVEDERSRTFGVALRVFVPAE